LSDPFADYRDFEFKCVPTVLTELLVAAPPDLCFSLTRDLDLHLRSMAHTGEQAVAGRISGLIGWGEGSDLAGKALRGNARALLAHHCL
jgi:hypothetical protein